MKITNLKLSLIYTAIFFGNLYLSGFLYEVVSNMQDSWYKVPTGVSAVIVVVLIGFFSLYGACYFLEAFAMEKDTENP